ncbi:MAG: sterol carrier family protein [Corynebacterium glucuronolyticum]|nr:sterol carrier family protein [Corynebacterium glucuronolyticum]MDD7587593.1 sterol carrier family protein [Mycobacteriaceae bacterium]MDY5835159.1 sterol carrier family protein [Corynebacterium glucuronolyticum]
MTDSTLTSALERVRAYAEHPDSTPKPERKVLKEAVKLSVEEVGARAPGHSVELRVPPYAAVQCIDGPRHTRGTPPNVVEMSPVVWLRLALGLQSFDDALSTGAISASGNRATEVGKHLPISR